MTSSLRLTIQVHSASRSLHKKRLTQEPRYYLTPDQLTNDLYVMCENCRTYNDPATTYWECARRLEDFVRARAAQATVTRKAAAPPS